MNALAARDSLFSELHVTVLKAAGFRKRGHWSVLDLDPTYLSAYVRASRWGSKTDAVFWIDIQVFHRAWFELLWFPTQFKGPSEGTPSLVSEELGKMCVPSLHTLEIHASTDIGQLTETLRIAMQFKALPVLQQCATLEGVLQYFESKEPPRHDLLARAGVCLLLGRKEEARELMSVAKDLAPHENQRRWLELREKSMWSNPSIERTA